MSNEEKILVNRFTAYRCNTKRRRKDDENNIILDAKLQLKASLMIY